MKKAYYQNLQWVKGTVQLLNGSCNYIPADAIEASNNTYILPNPAKLYFTVITDQNDCITEDIIEIVKDVNGWKKLSQPRYDKLNKKLIKIPNFEVDDYGIRNLEKLVKL